MHSSSWYSCKNKLVFNVEESSLNNTTSYILFHRNVENCTRIEFAHSIFRLNNPAVHLAITSVHPAINFGKAECKASLKHVRLQSRATSCGTTVNS